MMKNDTAKLLIPCYRDMDAYELPEEFAHLQAQDMGKIGFINDIVRGIKKVIVKEETAPITNIAPSTTAFSDTPNVTAILKNVYLFLDEGNWGKAKECFSRAISDYDPENVQAYLGELMATVQVKKKEDLKNYSRPFDGETSYKRLIRFADDSLKAEMEWYIAEISARVERQRLQKIRFSLRPHAKSYQFRFTRGNRAFPLNSRLRRLCGDDRKMREYTRKK